MHSRRKLTFPVSSNFHWSCNGVSSDLSPNPRTSSPNGHQVPYDASFILSLNSDARDDKSENDFIEGPFTATESSLMVPVRMLSVRH